MAKHAEEYSPHEPKDMPKSFVPAKEYTSK
jgi:hypothetical protein